MAETGGFKVPRTRQAIRDRERKNDPDNKLVDLRGALEKVAEANKKVKKDIKKSGK